MTYEAVEEMARLLSYRDKLRLAQTMIQIARQEEENANTSQKAEIDYSVIKERLRKSTPLKKKTLMNFIRAMFNFNGGISDPDLEKIVAKLQKEQFLKIDADERVEYLQN